MAIEKRCWSDECDQPHEDRKGRFGGPAYRVHITYKGAVLRLREQNWHDDSDFYAIVWNGERLTTDEYATTRFPTDENHAAVDATDEVRAAAGEWAVRVMRSAVEAEADAIARQIEVGKTVRVVAPVTRGKNKVAAGTSGRVFWMQESFSQYGTWSRGWRLGVEGPDGTFFIDAHRVEVVNPEVHRPSQESIERTIESYRLNPEGVILRGMGRPGLVVIA